MRGLGLFIVAIATVFANWQNALRIVALPFFVLLGLEFCLQQLETGVWRASIGVALANYLMTAIVAVSWHRFILLKEIPNNLTPRWNGKAFLSYLIALFVFGWVLIMILAVPFLAPLLALKYFAPEILENQFFQGLFAEDTSISGMVFGYIAFWAFLYMLFRLGLRLPHLALYRKSVGLDVSRALTKPIRGALAIVSALAAAAQIALVTPEILFPLSTEMPLMWCFLVVIGDMAIILFGASILTEIYRNCMPKGAPSK